MAIQTRDWEREEPGWKCNLVSLATNGKKLWWFLCFHSLNIFGQEIEKKGFLLTPTWFEHAAFWSGVRRATVAPRSQICRLLANLIRAHPCGLSVLFGKIRKLVDQNKSKRWRQKDCLLLKKREKKSTWIGRGWENDSSVTGLEPAIPRSEVWCLIH